MFLVSLRTAPINWATRAIVVKYNFAKYIFFKDYYSSFKVGTRWCISHNIRIHYIIYFGE